MNLKFTTPFYFLKYTGLLLWISWTSKYFYLNRIYLNFISVVLRIISLCLIVVNWILSIKNVRIWPNSLCRDNEGGDNIILDYGGAHIQVECSCERHRKDPQRHRGAMTRETEVGLTPAQATEWQKLEEARKDPPGPL